MGNCIPRWRGWREAPGVDRKRESFAVLGFHLRTGVPRNPELCRMDTANAAAGCFFVRTAFLCKIQQLMNARGYQKSKPAIR